ncbi:MAG: Rieske (2Fe-2S) protein [Gammaproteobacteria bacterium]|nr:Rieske (2Fe-2S) protein [Gammaproteobacteria bacterium]MDE1887274.1 Rieske (2Fe-2S) protein [Gammaproteobacteria bacterium]MDE2023179.1 Rieske (2Fe-2S) protein [Gammaproteobacteria bacterium]MDE2272850.1 Rieske (2Fe-2S) protein [Gammaproteobacteria bacterium]
MPKALRRVICPLSELPAPGARGFSRPGARFPDEYFVVRHGDALRAYRNICPHAGNGLNWKEDAFLTRDKTLIMCAAHGALFNPESGVCVAGPCVGRALQAVPVKIEDGMVVACLEGAAEDPEA